MEMALEEFPLALFTTFAPVSAGVFVALFFAFITDKFDEKEIVSVNRLTFIPVVLALVALVCSFFHLANPANAFNVANTIGSTPLANEILVFGIYFILSIVYWIAAMVGGLKARGARLVCSALVAAAGILMTIFIGIAYLIPIVPAWNNGLVVVQMLGIELFGGILLGMLICALGEKGKKDTKQFDMVMAIGVIAGLAMMIIGTCGMFAIASGTDSYILNVAAITGSMIPSLVLSIALSGVALIVMFVSMAKGHRVALICAVLLALFGIFFARFCFYGLQIPIGL